MPENFLLTFHLTAKRQGNMGSYNDKHVPLPENVLKVMKNIDDLKRTTKALFNISEGVITIRRRSETLKNSAELLNAKDNTLEVIVGGMITFLIS